jgi:hypothetical protein
MATISRTGITAGGTISPTHITNIIDALDGTGVGITVVATGSFTGSLVGNATTATTSSYLIGVGANNITITGSLNNSTLITATSGSIINLSGMTGGDGVLGKLILPSGQPSQPPAGAIYWDDGERQLYIYSDADSEWKTFVPG